MIPVLLHFKVIQGVSSFFGLCFLCLLFNCWLIYISKQNQIDWIQFCVFSIICSLKYQNELGVFGSCGVHISISAMVKLPKKSNWLNLIEFSHAKKSLHFPTSIMLIGLECCHLKAIHWNVSHSGKEVKCDTC